MHGTSLNSVCHPDPPAPEEMNDAGMVVSADGFPTGAKRKDFSASTRGEPVAATTAAAAVEVVGMEEVMLETATFTGMV